MNENNERIAKNTEKEFYDKNQAKINKDLKDDEQDLKEIDLRLYHETKETILQQIVNDELDVSQIINEIQQGVKIMLVLNEQIKEKISLINRIAERLDIKDYESENRLKDDKRFVMNEYQRLIKDLISRVRDDKEC